MQSDQYRIRELEAQVAALKQELKGVKKQRDLYRRDLDKERQGGNDHFLAGLEAAQTPFPLVQAPVVTLPIIVDAD